MSQNYSDAAYFRYVRRASYMINQEYHKGSFCTYTSVFCQEGYCAACEIYRKRPVATKQMRRQNSTESPKTSQPVLVH